MTDAELVAVARSGNIAGLATLLERHRARMRAIAAGYLGAGPECDDLAQDVCLVAICHLDSLRDADAAGAWLGGIARNLCFQRLQRRRCRSELSLDVGSVTLVSNAQGPEEIVDNLAVSDWVWSGLGALSEPLRTVVVLRYFSRTTSYQSIACGLGIPVGTVRSRLSQAREKLVLSLHEQADLAYGDHAALVRSRRDFFEATTDEYNRGAEMALLASALAVDAEIREGGGEAVARGRSSIVSALAADMEAGMRLQVLEVVAGNGITVVEGAFTNPLSDPDHCPRLTTQVYLHRGEEINRIHLCFQDDEAEPRNMSSV